MDASLHRRGALSVHAVFGESVAILVAFALVAIAARATIDPDSPSSLDTRLLSFHSFLLKALDSDGLIDGQVWDLLAQNPKASMRALKGNRSGLTCGAQLSRNDMKTVPLFQLAVRAGMLFADVSVTVQESLFCFGRDFGKTVQMMDDLVDGDRADWTSFLAQLVETRKHLDPFGVRGRELGELVDLLHAKTIEAKSHNASCETIAGFSNRS
jgi:geranylgeranyl pyrophosphate synthase